MEIWHISGLALLDSQTYLQRFESALDPPGDQLALKVVPSMHWAEVRVNYLQSFHSESLLNGAKAVAAFERCFEAIRRQGTCASVLQVAVNSGMDRE